MRSPALLLLIFLASCSSPPRPIGPPPRPATKPKETVPEAGACSDSEPTLRRFIDPQKRVSFCAPSGSSVGWLKAVEELNTIEEMWFAPDNSANFAVVLWKNVPSWGTAPGKPTVDAKIDLDETSAKLSGLNARHVRQRWHERRERSLDLDASGNHTHEEASDHDIVLERWSVLLPAPIGGMLTVTLRTQENTADETKKLFERMAASFRFERTN